MRHRNSHEVGQLDLIVVEKVLQVAHERWHLGMVRRNEHCILKGRSSNPILALPVFTGKLRLPANTCHQSLVRFCEQPGGNGYIIQSLDGIVHRLDKDTSGLLLVAKNNRAHRGLQSQFESRSLSKTYTALVRGKVEYEEGHISESIDRHGKIRRKMAVSHSETARDAETKYRVLKRFRYATLLEVKILTGRTHQIRVHMAHLGAPVAGDELYGTRHPGERLGLHASKIEFAHPTTGAIMSFKSELPAEFKEMIKKAESA